MISVIFVCLGNICRSPMAEFILKDLTAKKGLSDSFIISSAATSMEEIGNDMHCGAKSKLREAGVPFSKRRAVLFDDADFDYYDYILLMDKNNLRRMSYYVKKDTMGKIHMLMEYAGENRDIADPWYTGDFDKTYDDILKACQGFLKSLGY